jgi:hypothetical protein
LDFIHCLGVLKQPQHYGSWFDFYLQVTGGQKSNLFGPLIKLILELDSSNIKIPGTRPVDNSEYLLDITHHFYIGPGINLLSNPNLSVGDKTYIMSHR